MEYEKLPLARCVFWVKKVIGSFDFFITRTNSLNGEKTKKPISSLYYTESSQECEMNPCQAVSLGEKSLCRQM